MPTVNVIQKLLIAGLPSSQTESLFCAWRAACVLFRGKSIVLPSHDCDQIACLSHAKLARRSAVKRHEWPSPPDKLQARARTNSLAHLVGLLVRDHPGLAELCALVRGSDCHSLITTAADYRCGDRSGFGSRLAAEAVIMLGGEGLASPWHLSPPPFA